jgi:hypothetical protein
MWIVFSNSSPLSKVNLTIERTHIEINIIITRMFNPKTEVTEIHGAH